MTDDPLLAQARASLSALQSIANPLEVQLRTATIIARTLEPQGDYTIVVGGSAVSFYTGGAYLSRDVDLITAASGDQLGELMTLLGFERRDGAWLHTETDVIGLEDLLVDRLNAVVHWKDTEAREWCNRDARAPQEPGHRLLAIPGAGRQRSRGVPSCDARGRQSARRKGRPSRRSMTEVL